MTHFPSSTTEFMNRLLPLPRRIEIAGEPGSVPNLSFRMEGFDETDMPVLERIESLVNLPSSTASQAGAVGVVVRKGDVQIPDSARDGIREQAYSLDTSDGRVLITASGVPGVFYALQTLKQLLRGGSLPRVRIVDWPALPLRGIHMMFGVHSPSIECMRDLVDTLASARMNFMILEYDDRFPFESHPEVVSPLAFTKDQLRDLDSYARERFVEIVPLLDSLGHVGEYLRCEENKHLREMPGNTYAMCPSNPESLKFIKELWTEVLEVHDRCRFAHVTGDEIFGRVKLCERCSSIVESSSLGALFGGYYRDLGNWMLEHGRRPMMWSDTVIALPDALDLLPPETVFHHWQYWPMTGQEEEALICTQHQGAGGTITMDNLDRVPSELRRVYEKYWRHPERKDRFKPFPYTDFFQDRGFDVIGGPACSSEEGILSIPTFEGRVDNARWFARALDKSRAMGLANTFWNGRHSITGCMTGIMAGGAYSWNPEQAGDGEFLDCLEKQCLDLPGGVLREHSRLTDPVNVSPRGYVSGMAMPLGDEADKLAEALKKAEPAGMCMKSFRDILVRSLEQARLFSECQATFAEIGRIAVGRGKYLPVDIGPVTNLSMASLVHLPSRGFGDMACGEQDAWGVPFLVPDTGKGILLKGAQVPDRPDKVDVDLNIVADRVFFLHACAWAYNNTTPMLYRFVYDDDTSSEMPVVVGGNINGWSTRNNALPGALEAWHGWRYGAGGAIMSAYLAWWDNPDPDKKLARVELMAGEAESGYGMVMGITARTQSEPVRIEEPVRRRLLDSLESYERDLETLRGRFRSVFEKTMTSGNAKIAAERFIRFDLKSAIDVHRKMLESMASQGR